MENLLTKNTNDELRIKFNVLTQKTRCIMKMFDEAFEKKKTNYNKKLYSIDYGP
jgi:hypothetical protein